MSTAAHEPRRVGPRRADSPSGSKVAPRRNAPETSEQNGLQYDSDELPVLIRLPNLHDLGSIEKQSEPRAQKKHHSSNRKSAGEQKTSAQSASKVAKKPVPQQAGSSKLVIGGIAGGILVVVLLLLFNAGSPEPPTNEDGWASEAAELEPAVQEPDFSFAAEIEPPALNSGLAGEAPETESAQFASGQFASGQFDNPELYLPIGNQSETAAFPSENRSAQAWPPDEMMELQPGPGSPAPDLWPGQSLSLEQGGSEYTPANSPGQSDYRSSMYPSETESFRMGKLDSDRPQEGDRSSILDGIIETPDTRNLR